MPHAIASPYARAKRAHLRVDAGNRSTAASTVPGAMRPPDWAVRTEGAGTDIIFIHGTAGDKSSWAPAVRLLRGSVRTTVYDRRGTPSWDVAGHDRALRVEDHAEDAADLIVGLGTAPVHVCAGSFGAVVALELLRRRPELLQSAVLFEPAVSGSATIPSVPRGLLLEFERLVQAGEPERAAHVFCMRVFGPATWEALSCQARDALTAKWKHIRADLLANDAYCVPYAELHAVRVPVLLLRGGRSRPAFEPGVHALHIALPLAQRNVIDHADHVPFGEAWSELTAAVMEFVRISSAGDRCDRVARS